MEAKTLTEQICDLLAQDRPVAVATILSREGSAPRIAGSKMVIEPGGSFTGTIGGGQFEADVLSAADQALDKGRPQKLFFDLTSDDADLAMPP